jgi:hypothetical protein
MFAYGGVDHLGVVGEGAPLPPQNNVIPRPRLRQEGGLIQCAARAMAFEVLTPTPDRPWTTITQTKVKVTRVRNFCSGHPTNSYRVQFELPSGSNLTFGARV